MMAAEPSLVLYTATIQTPPGATPLDVPGGATPDEIDSIITRHGIQAFWPQNYALRMRDEQPRCEHHAAADADTLAMVDDKARFHLWLGDDERRPIQRLANGVEQAEHEHRALVADDHETCVKPNIGVNGSGYWRFVREGGFDFLSDPEPREIDFDIWRAAAAARETQTGPIDHLIMEWLPGPEASVDILCWRGRPLVHAVRTKIDANHQRIQSDHEVVAHARSVVERLGLHGPASIQYRLDARGKWRILEVNARPAGGSIHSDDVGFGIISDWARLIAGTRQPDEIEQFEHDVLVKFERRAVVV